MSSTYGVQPTGGSSPRRRAFAGERHRLARISTSEGVPTGAGLATMKEDDRARTPQQMAHPPHACRRPRPRIARLVAAGCLLTLLSPLTAMPPALSQGWGGPWGPGRMGMGYSDQHFIVRMIPHHDGAIAMADLALTQARRPEIKALARSIKDSQTQENAQMRAWYRKWYGQDVPTWALGAGWGWQGGMGGPMGMGGGGLGMHGGTNLTALRQAADFDRAFIEQMIPHHQMGVMMASMAQINSQHPELRALQESMVRVQSEEIRQMEQWYRSWY
ncbi:hypothetical protein BBFGKLBO_00220 [Synechococcus sp. CBW1107]|uniref:DUF305 domain-containing protein n=2 Tax=Synechococcus sp. CBW1107 TaxID=2789857 RepID=UPI001E355FFF|nr:DUF305 domain-containing protein [Synechococcus sp. CBW1107]CAK6687470.1 hypothetical protein BBFGKLBO_00220 [Synechococcus sp. CBW1107]